MNPQPSSVGRVLAAWPILGTAYRVALIADEAVPFARRALRLVRAEARLAKESVPLVLWAGVVALLGMWFLIGTLAAGVVCGLVALGWPLGWAILVPAVLGLLGLVIGGLLLRRGVSGLTFAQSRARLNALMEVIDDE